MVSFAGDWLKTPIVYLAIGAAVGKQISTARRRRYVCGDHAHKRGFSSGAYFHGVGGDSNGVDANHRNSSGRKVAQAAALRVVQLTLTVPRVFRISTQIFVEAACEFSPASCMGNLCHKG